MEKIATTTKRRAEFFASSIKIESDGMKLRFIGKNADEWLLISANGNAVTASTSATQKELQTIKIQLLEPLSWLTLDFEPKSEFSRIVVHIAGLDFRLLDSDLKVLIGKMPVLYFHH